MDSTEPVDVIPGLDEEAAMLCLARVPRAYHKTLRHVCRSWRALLHHPRSLTTSDSFGVDAPHSLISRHENLSPDFPEGVDENDNQEETFRAGVVQVDTGGLYQFRRQLGFAETWIFLRTRTSTFVNHWRYFDVTNQVWAPRLPEIPYIAAALDKRIQQGTEPEGPIADSNKVRGLGSAAVGARVYVFGGWQEGGPSLTDVFCYDAISERWSRKAPMLTPRCYMATAVVGTRIFVAGGMSRPRLHQSELLVSAEVYDTERDTWTALPDMPFAMFFSCAIEVGGQVYVSGSRPPLDQGTPGRGCIFDAARNAWTIFMDTKLGDVMLSPCASVGDWLFAVSSSGIQAWNSISESWHVAVLDGASTSSQVQGSEGFASSIQSRDASDSAPGLLAGASPTVATPSQLTTESKLLLTTALKDCVFMGRLPCSSGCHMILLHRSGAITLVSIDFKRPQKEPLAAATGQNKPSRCPSGQLSSQTPQEESVGPLTAGQSPVSNPRLPRWDGIVPDQWNMPVVTLVKCLSVRPPLDDEQPVDMALITL